MDDQEQIKAIKIIALCDFYRGLILDTVEESMRGMNEWTRTRITLLRLLGDKGLDGKLRDILGMPKREREN